MTSDRTTAANPLFAIIRKARRIWAIGPVHGDLRRLRDLHRHIGEHFHPGDRLVYLGGFMGRGPEVAAVIDELLAFRRQVLALPGLFAADLIYLRGQQEEMWSKLLQLQFAQDAQAVLLWLLRQGVGASIAAYGGNPAAGIAACREGTLALVRWTGSLRAAQAARPGHGALLSALKHAAYTAEGALLFTHAGLDPARPLTQQGDALWWGDKGFAALSSPYGDFAKVVRGFDPAHRGPADSSFALTLDGGAGFGGKAALGLLDPAGNLLDLVEA